MERSFPHILVSLATNVTSSLRSATIAAGKDTIKPPHGLPRRGAPLAGYMNMY
jgi:hypothetical protein